MSKKRRRAFVAFALLVVVAAPCGVFLDGRSRQAARLSAKFAELDAAEPGWRLAELHGARNARLPPDEANAAAQALAARKLVPPGAGWPKFLAIYAELNRCGAAPPDAAILAGAEAFRAECAGALAEARRASDLPRGGLARTDFEPDAFAISFLKQDSVIEAACLLVLDAAVEGSQGRPVEALAACRGALNLARGGIGAEPTRASQLCRANIATRAVAATEWTVAHNADCSPELLAGLQVLFAEERSFDRLGVGRRGERAWVIRAFEQVEAGSAVCKPYGGGAAPTWNDQALTWYLRKHSTQAQLAALEFFDALAGAECLPDPERDAAAVRLVEAQLRLDGLPKPDKFIRSMVRVVSYVNEVESALRARLGCAIAALACERFRIATGRFPATLAELPPTLLAAVPADPYTGRPLMLRRDESGLAVYSTGPDKTDDGGETLSDRGGAGTDAGFRLWEAGRR